MAITKFIWDELSDNLLMETDKNDLPTVVYTHMPERFGELISQKRDGVTSYYHYDGEHSTRMLTDENQNITDTYIYSAYGELVARTGTTTNPFGYKGAVGYYTNSATNDIYVRARTYQPVTGRWLSMDPLGFVDGPNLYRAYFVPGGVDPSGLRPVCCNFRRGWVINEWFFEEVECPIGKSASDCCRGHINFVNWYVFEWAIDGPCGRPPPYVPPVVLLVPEVGFGTSVAVFCQAHPVITAITCAGVIIDYQITCDDRTFPEVDGNDDEPWGPVCCVWAHWSGYPIRREDTVCWYSYKADIEECCDENLHAGFDLVDAYPGNCGLNDGW